MVDLSAIAKWPNVPACYDWLSLDRRGCWRLQGERITHGGLIAFINQQYGCDAAGRWFMQNGPQRVFVSLACTPWIFRYDADGFSAHTGQAAGAVRSAFLDPEGNILLATELGIGLLDDRDLPRFLGECRSAEGQLADESAFAALMESGAGDIRWQGLKMQMIAPASLPGRFNFDPHPQAENA